MILLDRSFNVEQSIAFTGTSQNTGSEGTFVPIDNSWSSVDIPNPNPEGQWLVLNFDGFGYQSSSPSVMGVDIRFVIDGNPTRAFRVARLPNIVRHVEDLLPGGSHLITIEVRGVLLNGPPGPVRFFGTGRLLVQAKLARTYAKQICVSTRDGGLWHGMEYADYSWQPQFGNVKANAGDPGKFISVSCCMGKDAIGVDQALNVCGITADGGLWHSTRLSVDGSWSQFSDIKVVSGNPGIFKSVACAIAHREFHICCVTVDGGLWHTFRREDGLWQSQFGDVKGVSGSPGKFIAVDCCEDDNDLFVCGVTEDGGVWRTLRYLDGTWLPQFVDLKMEAGNPGSFAAVAFSEYDGVTEVVGLATDGNLWSTTRGFEGWQKFKDVRVLAGNSGNFTALDSTYDYGEFCLYSVASDGHIWRTEYKRLGTQGWQQFEDVKEQSANPDNITSIACALVPPMID